MVAELRPADWRRPGCGDSCRRVVALVIGERMKSEIELHDPDAHEAYARTGLAEFAPIATGPLVFDRGSMSVSVAGERVSLTPRELAIVQYLAERLNRICTYWEIIRGVWGPEYAAERPSPHRLSRLTSHEDGHLLRVNLARIRPKLGPAGRLIETRANVGLILRAEPPIGAEP